MRRAPGSASTGSASSATCCRCCSLNPSNSATSRRSSTEARSWCDFRNRIASPPSSRGGGSLARRDRSGRGETRHALLLDAAPDVDEDGRGELLGGAVLEGDGEGERAG